MKCLECSKEFSSVKSLHAHLKAHNGQKAYYCKFFPRYDLFDGSHIEFITKKQYFSSFFNSKYSRNLFYKNAPDLDIRNLMIKEFYASSYSDKISKLPTETFFMLDDLFSFELIKKKFGNIKNFCEKVGVKQQYFQHLPTDFWEESEEKLNFEILIDTREQKPFEFKNSLSQKLSMGDYMTASKYFSKMAIDRKSASDFKNSFGGSVDRIKKNLQEARNMGYKLYFIIEEMPFEIEKENDLLGKKKVSMGFIYKNVKEILCEYSDVTQILFCLNRNFAADLTRKIIFYGERVWNVDIQYFINKKLNL